jgi:hypothetical protein
MSYGTNLNTLAELEQRLARRIGADGRAYHPLGYACDVTGLEHGNCEGPHYTLRFDWATNAIFDRIYRPRAEPVVNWRFNVIDRPGLVLTVTPIYEPKAVTIQSWTTPCFEGHKPDTLAEAEEMHQLFYGTSNWSTTWSFLLRVLDPVTHRTVRGYLQAEDYAYTHMMDPDLAQPVLDTLWAATQGDPRAFAGATHCAFCGHPLSDALSAARGYGPDCAKHYKLPWLKVVSSTAATNIGVSP